MRNRSKNVDREQTKSGKPTITCPKSTRNRRCRHHLGHGIDQRPGHLGDHGIRTKRKSVLIGNRQLIGTAQKRVSVPNGDRPLHGSHHSQASMTTKITSVCIGPSVYCIPSRTVYTERTYSQPQECRQYTAFVNSAASLVRCSSSDQRRNVWQPSV